MYEVNNTFEVVYVLLNDNTYKYKYKSYNDFLLNTTYEWAERNIGNSFDHYYTYKYECYNEFKFIATGNYYKYIVQTVYGVTLDRDNILKDILAFKKHTPDKIVNTPTSYYDRWYIRKYGKRVGIFRVDPVPGVGHGKYHTIFRSPKTTQERRELDKVKYEECETGYKIKVRGKRKYDTLPTEYDDIYKSNIRDKSWKNYRKHQWK